MEHFHPGFSQPLRIHSRPRYWNLLENVFEQDLKSLKSDQYCCKTKSVEKAEEKSSTEEENKMEVQSDKNSEEKKAVEPVTKTNLKQFMSSVRCLEDNEEKFERKFKLTSNVLFDKIESKLDNKEENL